MGMNVTPESLKNVLTLLENVPRDIDKACEDVFAEAGIYVVYGIRSGQMSSWDNQTGNLRSSIGWAVGRKGRVVRKSRFGTVLEGSEGSAKGEALIERLASEYSQYDLALFIVAGEEYAVYVEAINNKVVLAGGYLYLEKNLVRRMQERISTVLRKYENRR